MRPTSPARAVGLALLVTAAAVACGGEPDVLRVGYLPVAGCLPLLLAQELGYFEDEGLSVELARPERGGGDVILEAIQTGIFDVGYSNVVSLAMSRLGDAPGARLVSVYGGISEAEGNPTHGLLVRKALWDGTDAAAGARERASEALRGALIAVSGRNNIAELMTLAYLNEIGLGEDDVYFVAMPFDAMLESLEDSVGAIDAGSSVEPFLSRIDTGRVTRLPDSSWYDRAKSANLSAALSATYVARSDSTRAMSTRLSKFRGAMDRVARELRGMTPSAIRDEFGEVLDGYEEYGPEFRFEDLPSFEGQADEPRLDWIIRLMRDHDFLAAGDALSARDLLWSADSN